MYLHQCSTKCGTGAGCKGRKGSKLGTVSGRESGEAWTVPCFCDGYCKDTSNEYCDAADTETEFSICGDAALCQSLCDASPACYGIEMSKGLDRCYLLSPARQTRGEVKCGSRTGVHGTSL